jgi:uncharacterized membrane protein
MGANLASPVVAELGTIVLAALVFYAASKRYGVFRAGLFLAGALVWTSIIENLAAVAGEYSYYYYAGQLLPGYPGYLFWVGMVPLWILLGWFVLSMSGFVIFHEVLLSTRGAVVQAAASGLFALNVDLMLDPAASANNLWIWQTGSFSYLGVPLANFFGWFLLIFVYDIIVGRTIFSERSLPIVSRVEKVFFGRGAGEGPRPVLRSFFFRILVLDVVVFAVLFYFASFLDYLASVGL